MLATSSALVPFYCSTERYVRPLPLAAVRSNGRSKKNKKTDHKQKPKGRNVAVIRCKLFALLEEMDEPRRSAIDLRPASHVFVSFLFFYFYYISFCFGRRERERVGAYLNDGDAPIPSIGGLSPTAAALWIHTRRISNILCLDGPWPAVLYRWLAFFELESSDLRRPVQPCTTSLKIRRLHCHSVSKSRVTFCVLGFLHNSIATGHYTSICWTGPFQVSLSAVAEHSNVPSKLTDISYTGRLVFGCIMQGVYNDASQQSSWEQEKVARRRICWRQSAKQSLRNNGCRNVCFSRLAVDSSWFDKMANGEFNREIDPTEIGQEN